MTIIDTQIPELESMIWDNYFKNKSHPDYFIINQHVLDRFGIDCSFFEYKLHQGKQPRVKFVLGMTVVPIYRKMSF